MTLRRTALTAAVLLAVGLRIVALDSDPYPWLDWCTGLLTDEGFYTHNARNVAMFGRARLDDFNNMLVSPLVHAVQTAVFLVLGSGAVPGRLISVACSLAAAALLYAALRRSFGARVAATGALLLALDHANLLFSRMALLDPPAALLAVAAFWCFVRGQEAVPGTRGRAWWMAACGAFLGLAAVSRSLCVYLIPVPFAALWIPLPPAEGRRRALRDSAGVAAGLAGVLAAWALLWYLPHRAEIDAMHRYYREAQARPKSLARLAQNVRLALLGDRYGWASCLFRHTPVVFVLALLALASRALGRRSTASRAESFLAAWLLSAWTVLAASSYSPYRYHVTFYPALMSLAAVALWEWRESAGRLASPGPGAAVLRAALAWLLAWHAVQSVLHRGGVLPPGPTQALLFTIPTAAAAAAAVCHGGVRWARVPIAAAGLWTLVNAGWLAHWAATLDYTQRDLGRWLAAALPSGSVLLGDVAPGVSMDTRFLAVNVMKGLCNDDRPVERFAGRPRFILTLDGAWMTPYWPERYRALVARSRRIRLARVLRWQIGIYPVSLGGSQGVPAGRGNPRPAPGSPRGSLTEEDLLDTGDLAVVGHKARIGRHHQARRDRVAGRRKRDFPPPLPLRGQERGDRPIRTGSHHEAPIGAETGIANHPSGCSGKLAERPALRCHHEDLRLHHARAERPAHAGNPTPVAGRAQVA